MEMDELVVAHSRDESGTSRKCAPGNPVTRCGCHQVFQWWVPLVNSEDNSEAGHHHQLEKANGSVRPETR